MTYAQRAALAGIVILGAPAMAHAQGISARFGNDAAVIGQDVVIRVEVTDPVGAVAKVEVDLGEDGEAWRTVRAAGQEPVGDGTRWWHATYTSTTVWTARAPTTLAVRARLYGARGGLVLELGAEQPLTVDVITPAEAEKRARVLTTERAEAEPELPFSGYIGADGRAGTGARARAYLGFGAPVGSTTELIGFVSIGPAFERPDNVAGGGPITLGAELAARLYTRALGQGAWSLFAAPYGTVDVRFGGVDAGGGVRVGISWIVRSELSVEAALGGAAVAFGVVEAEGDDPGLGFMGGLRIGLRLGPIADE